MRLLDAMVLLTLLRTTACDRPTAEPARGNPATPSTNAATGAATTAPAQTTQAKAPPAGTTCTPHFTPHQPGAQHCSANHTVCRDGPNGEECHGGAILIPCGESGERCGKTFFCDCGDAGRATD